MKECTLGLLYFCKFGELAFTFCWTWYSWWNGIAFITKADESKLHLQIMAGIAIILITYHFFFMNLLINIRFWCRLQCVSLCTCTWKCINKICCRETLKGFCVDRFFKKNTMIKWAVFFIYFVVTGSLVRAWNYE
jgi:hypothetical protein